MKEGYRELLGEPISYFEDVNKLIGDLRTILTKAAEFHRKHPYGSSDSTCFPFNFIRFFSRNALHDFQ